MTPPRRPAGWFARGASAGGGESGQAMVEMALVLPIMFLLLFGMFELSIVLFGYGNATYASRVGARYACLHSSTSLAPSSSSAISNLVQPYLFFAPSGGATITTTWSPSNTIGSTVSVSVTIVYPIGVPLLALSQITVGGNAQRTIMR